MLTRLLQLSRQLRPTRRLYSIFQKQVRRPVWKLFPSPGRTSSTLNVCWTEDWLQRGTAKLIVGMVVGMEVGENTIRGCDLTVTCLYARYLLRLALLCVDLKEEACLCMIVLKTTKSLF